MSLAAFVFTGDVALAEKRVVFVVMAAEAASQVRALSS